MADDIVTRLRAGNKHYGDLQSDATVYEEAADEIERLRAEVTRWKELAADLAMTCAINEMEGGDA